MNPTAIWTAERIIEAVNPIKTPTKTSFKSNKKYNSSTCIHAALKAGNITITRKKLKPILKGIGIVRYENSGNVTKKEVIRINKSRKTGILAKLVILSNIVLTYKSI